jgi:hypothetical protein
VWLADWQTPSQGVCGRRHTHTLEPVRRLKLGRGRGGKGRDVEARRTQVSKTKSEACDTSLVVRPLLLLLLKSLMKGQEGPLSYSRLLVSLNPEP